jgi:hypothetical protein
MYEWPVIALVLTRIVPQHRHFVGCRQTVAGLPLLVNFSLLPVASSSMHKASTQLLQHYEFM